MKSFLGFSGKLFLVFFATSVVSFVSMLMCLSADMGIAFKVFVGMLFGFFIMFLAWSNALERGEKDTRDKAYKAYKGFLAGLIAMIPALVLAVAYMIITYYGWERGERGLADGIYTLLYMMFISFSPLLSTFVTFNPALNIDFAQPTITMLENITTPNAVYAPLFFIPIFIFIIVTGVGYIFGNKERKNIMEAVKKAKNSRKM